MKERKDVFEAAEIVAQILKDHGVEPIVIGAIAMAVHRHIRFTEDLDLGVNAEILTLRELVSAFEAEQFEVHLREPDTDDPLSGVIDIIGPFGLIQVVSFSQRFPAVINDSLQASTLSLSEGSLLKIPPLPHLIALKLYAGGIKSAADIISLLIRNPDADLEAIRTLCKKYRLRGLDALVAEAEVERSNRPNKDLSS